MSLVSRLEDAIRATLREEFPSLTDQQIAPLESRLVDLFMQYAAEHYKLMTKRSDPRQPIRKAPR